MSKNYRENVGGCRDKKREYAQENKDARRCYLATYQEQNAKGLKAKRKGEYKENRGVYIKKARKYYQENKERVSLWSDNYYKENKSHISRRKKEYYQKNRERILKEAKETYLFSKKVTHTVSQIKNFFIGKCWPYQTTGKNEITKDLINLSREFFPEGQQSFLSMPHFGRELHMMDEMIDLENSLGIERDFKTFNTILRAFKKILPGYDVQRGCIDEFAINSKRVFDIAHLDYNGPLIESHLHAADSLVKKNTLTFMTLSQHKRFEGMDLSIPVEELANIGEIVYKNEYIGLRKCPMVTIGVI